MEPTPPPTGPVGPPPGSQGPGHPGPPQGSGPPYPNQPGQNYPPPPQSYPPPPQGYPPPGQGYPAPGQGGYPPGQGGYGQGGYPPGQGFQPYPGGNQPGQRRGTSTLAILTFIFGLLAAVPVAIVLGIIALTKIAKTGDKGQGLAIAGMTFAGLWVAGFIAAAALADPSEPDRDASGQVTTTQNVSSNKLRVGDCVTEIKEGEVRDIKVQPCNQPNGGKVYAVFDLPAGKWPGLTQVQAAAEKGCTDRFKALKQPANQPSDIWYLHPTEDSWSLGDHGTTCLVAPK
ncbi:septum formation family protein [Kribbella qitaiheensis]|uniref:DUF4190 domain-containing protein n=1 Tax=Kribbella qitaiheensis TaxID=1544730 RepID=UPI00360A3414